MGWRALLALTLGMALVDAHAQNYPTPGFDCANTSAPLELRICRSAQLSELDGRHWYLADRAIRGSADREKTRSEVEDWINRVRNDCQTDACLVDAYTTRNAFLEGSVAQLAPEKPPPQPRMLPTPPAAPPAPGALSAVVAPEPNRIAPAPAPVAVATEKPEEGDGGWVWFGVILGLIFVAYVMLRNAKRK